MFVTPNLCHDMHDCSVAVGDAWVSAWVRMMVKSRAYRAGHTAIFLTFDEGMEPRQAHPDGRRQPLHPRRHRVTPAATPTSR